MSTRKLVSLSLLGSVSFVLMLLNFPIPGLPPYLKLDFSEIPALLAAIIFGPVAGIIVEGLKNTLYYLAYGSGVPVGEIANFISGVIFIVPVAFIYHRLKSKRSLIGGCLIGTVSTIILMSILNYYLLLPAYTWFLGYDAMSHSVKITTITIGIIPFNAIKGIAVMALFIPLFTKLQPWIEKQRSIA
ncbi:ECF transporter S component [Bacillus solimangrovi]|nr:ECF transporter S component [Bacillus solimangrovi]